MAEGAPLLRVYRFNPIEGSNPSLSAILARLLLMAFLAFATTACDGQKIEEIEWQLPLSVPVYPHASNLGKDLPEWASTKEGHAKVVFLKKSTARTFGVTVENKASQVINGWTVEILGLASGLRIKDKTFINDESISNPAAYLALYQGQKLEYKGWVYQDFPELFGMDNLDWKVWIEDVTMPQVSQETEEKLLP